MTVPQVEQLERELSRPVPGATYKARAARPIRTASSFSIFPGKNPGAHDNPELALTNDRRKVVGTLRFDAPQADQQWQLVASPPEAIA